MTRLAKEMMAGLIVLLVLWANNSNEIVAQGYGGFGGGGTNLGGGNRSYADGPGTWTAKGQLEKLPPEVALNIITIDGTVNHRIEPEEIRVVFAIVAEGKTAAECKQQNEAIVDAVIESWRAIRIDSRKIVKDFINVLPVYEWRVEKRDGENVRTQQKTGYRIQSNLHVSVKSEDQAMKAIGKAFEHDVTEIVTFDYWNSKLDDAKNQARAAALKAARQKAKVMLEAFEETPKLVNVQESTKVFLPNTLYQTYTNALEEKMEYNRRRDMPAIKAYRPKMTFFQGLQSSADVNPKSPAMHPEINVASTVRLYFQSPAEKAVVVRPGK